MPNQWYLYAHHQQTGPFPWEELRRQAHTGLFGPEDLVWSEGMTGWTPANQVAELFLDPVVPPPPPPLLGSSPPPPPSTPPPPPLPGSISWEADISLLTNPLILKQTALVVLGAGLLMALLLSFILATTGDVAGIPAMLAVAVLVTAGFGVLILLVMLIFFGGRLRVRFTVDSEGALWETVDTRAKAAGRLAILAGILGRSPQTAGAGTLAVSREKEWVSWRELSLVETDQRHRMITLRNSWRPVLMLVCLPENYHRVEVFARENVIPAAADAQPVRKPLGRALWRTGLVALAAAPLFMLSDYPFELDIFVPLLMFMFALATVWLVPLFGWVVIGCAALLAVLLTGSGFSEFHYAYGYEQAAFVLSYAGLGYLVWFSWKSLVGKIRPPLLEG